MIYQAIVGSRSHNVETTNSDIDIAVSKIQFLNCETSYDSKLNTFSIPVHMLLDMMMKDNKPPWFVMQYLFPEKFLVENDLSRFILENREWIVSAQLPKLYQVYLGRAEGLSCSADWLYDSHPKRMTYSTLLFSTLANYADGMSFAQAHRPEGELHDFLIGMRLGEVPLEDALARNKQERLRAEKASGFYQECIHPEILQDFEQVIQDVANKY